MHLFAFQEKEDKLLIRLSQRLVHKTGASQPSRCRLQRLLRRSWRRRMCLCRDRRDRAMILLREKGATARRIVTAAL